MSPTSTTSTALARIRSRSATAATMCQQGRPMSPPPSTRMVSTDSSLYSPLTSIKPAVVRCFCKAYGNCACCWQRSDC